MSYRLAEKAEEDIICVYSDGVRLFGTDQAEHYHRELEAIFELLARHPKLARQRHEIRPPVRIHPHKSHLIVYLDEGNGDVLILRVRHGHEDWESDPV